MVGGGNQERLADARVVQVMGNGSKQGRHDFHQVHVLTDLRTKRYGHY